MRAWEWFAANTDLVMERLLEHVGLTGAAVGAGIAIALPLAILAHRRPRLAGPILWTTGILYTIPSLAALALLLPLLGLSAANAIVVLTTYTLLILVRNTVTGLREVPADVRDAARAAGHTPRQLLWRVELPLALPAIVAGIRIATVTTIGLVTVTALIGKGGLGYLMLAGFRPLLPEAAIVVGIVLSVGLALTADLLLVGLQRALGPWAGRRR
ncbi:MAG TPA: ABC transporter permease subunit [Actinomycetota bacterium]|nr:ABC transporter permease subunit [Actinomycetota bacterium]